jgi:hypothetical protein
MSTPNNCKAGMTIGPVSTRVISQYQCALCPQCFQDSINVPAGGEFPIPTTPEGWSHFSHLGWLCPKDTKRALALLVALRDSETFTE